MENLQSATSVQREIAIITIAVPQELRDRASYVFDNGLDTDRRFWEIALSVGFSAMVRAKRKLDAKIMSDDAVF